MASAFALASAAVQQYIDGLQELTFNSKPIITNLTIIAGEIAKAHGPPAASSVAAAIENHIRSVRLPSRLLRTCAAAARGAAAARWLDASREETSRSRFRRVAPLADAQPASRAQVSQECKLPALYLLDSVAKNLRSPYAPLFEPRLAELYLHVHAAAPPPQRSSLEHLRNTWRPIFPAVRAPVSPLIQPSGLLTLSAPFLSARSTLPSSAPSKPRRLARRGARARGGRAEWRRAGRSLLRRAPPGMLLARSRPAKRRTAASALVLIQ
jgi:hypothetical protein